MGASADNIARDRAIKKAIANGKHKKAVGSLQTLVDDIVNKEAIKEGNRRKQKRLEGINSEEDEG